MTFAFLLIPAMGQETGKWETLFNGKDLDGWSVRIENAAPGEIPNGHVVVRDGAIQMYPDLQAGDAVAFGTVYHKQKFSRFHLSFEYKWGKKQFEPRPKGLRDAGLLYHIADLDHVVYGVWPASVECQIQEGDTGDIMLVDTGALTWINPEPDKAPEGQGTPGMLPEDGGVPTICGKGKYVGRYPVADKLEGWNSVDAVVQAGESAIHKVNGVVRARLALTKDLQGKVLDSGLIGLQLEGAEILYRNIRIRELPEPLVTDAPYVSVSSVAGVSTGKCMVSVRNPGRNAVSLGLSITGKDADLFTVESPVTSLEAGGQTHLSISMKPAAKPGRYSAGLQIGTEDEGVFVILQGLATKALEGENEPPLQRIVESLGIPLNVGSHDLKLGTDAAIIGDSKEARFFRRTGGEKVKMTPLARYSPPGNYPFGWETASGGSEVGTLADSTDIPDAHQRLFPPIASGRKSAEFSTGNEAFSLYVRAGKGTIGTDPVKHPSHLAHAVRVYPVSVVQGRPVSNALLVCFEEASNGDYQDSVFLMENVEIADAP